MHLHPSLLGSGHGASPGGGYPDEAGSSLPERPGRKDHPPPHHSWRKNNPRSTNLPPGTISFYLWITIAFFFKCQSTSLFPCTQFRLVSENKRYEYFYSSTTDINPYCRFTLICICNFTRIGIFHTRMNAHTYTHTTSYTCPCRMCMYTRRAESCLQEGISICKTAQIIWWLSLVLVLLMI